MAGEGKSTTSPSENQMVCVVFFLSLLYYSDGVLSDPPSGYSRLQDENDENDFVRP